MFDQITREHILSAFEQAEGQQIRRPQTYYLIYKERQYPPIPILQLAYQIAYKAKAPYFNSQTAVRVLSGYGFVTLRTDGLPSENQVASSSYTWVPFYQEMCAKLHQYTPAKLINILQELKIDGLRDKSKDGPHDMMLGDIDPYTFLSFINKFGNTNRLAFLGQLRPLLNLTTSIPTDMDGVPTAQAQSVWLFGYKYRRQPDDIDKLKALYQQVHDDALTASLFEDVLKIYQVGSAKLTEVLFYQKPDMYLPVNGQTKPWLKKRSLPFRYKTFAEYEQILRAVRQHDPRRFYEISHEAYLENTKPRDSAHIRYYCVKTTFGESGDLLPQFIEEGIWQNGYEKEWKKYQEVIKTIPIGSKLAAKSAFSHGPAGQTASQLKILALGEVVQNSGDGKTLEVVWDEDFEPFTLMGKGHPYQKTLQEVIDKDDIRLIFFHQIDQPVSPMPFPTTSHAKNTILYGPPGTGKTYETIDLAVTIIDGHNDSNHKVNKDRFDVLKKEGRIEFVTFHQNYTYEDFVVGIKPDTEGKDLKFQRNYGIFYKLAKQARENYEASQAVDNYEGLRPFDQVLKEFKNQVATGKIERVKLLTGEVFKIYDVGERTIVIIKDANVLIPLDLDAIRKHYGNGEYKEGHSNYYRPVIKCLESIGNKPNLENKPIQNYVLIIDEINRANMSRVFGELITLLEDDKRLGGDNALTVTLSSGESFTVPPNLYLIGTMNTADKSLALLDVALRRRFEFIGKYPNYEVVNGPAKGVLERLNKAILAHHKPADFLIGHAYFIGKQPEQLPGVFNNRVIPLLMEYFNGRTDLVKTVLADAGISSERHPLTDQLTVDYVE